MNKLAALFLIGLISAGALGVYISNLPGKKPFKRNGHNEISRAYMTKTANGGKRNVIKKGDRKLENSSSNIVTAVVLDYRGFDTLGEVTVLFAAIAGIGLLLGASRRRRIRPAGPVISSMAPWIAAFIIITSAYIFLHGHLSPGGGFPGGAMIAAGFLIMVLGVGSRAPKIFKTIETLGGLAFVTVGVIGFLKKGSFLQNAFGSGEVGTLFGSIFLGILYAIIGFKVAAELSSGFGEFVVEEEGKHE